MEVHFLLGVAAIGVAENTESKEEKDTLLHSATLLLHAILVDHPEFDLVRLELARALFLQGKDDLAKQYFEQVLVGNPPPPTAVSIRRFLSAIRARRRWDGYFSFSIAPDTNVNGATETRTIEIFGLPFTINEESRARSGIGALLSGGLAYQHPLNKHWQWRLGADALRREYGAVIFDETNILMHTGPRYTPNDDLQTSLFLTGGQRWLSKKRYSWEFGGRFEARYRFNRRLTTFGNASLSKRSHRQSPGLDGLYKNLALSGNLQLTPLIQLNAALGLSRDTPEAPTSRTRSWRASIGTGFILPSGWTLSGRTEWARTRYDTSNTVLVGDNTQVNRRRTYSVRILNRGWTLWGFSPQLGLIHENQKSNNVFSQYKRNRAELKIVRQF